MTLRPIAASTYRTSLETIALPFPCDVDRAPQLVAVTLALAALAALHRALDSAHPILAATRNQGHSPVLDDSEHFAACALDTAEHLTRWLSDYRAAVVVSHDDDSPF